MDNPGSAATITAESLSEPHQDTPTGSSDHHDQPTNPPPETTGGAGEKRKRDDGEGEVNKSSAVHPFYKTSLCSFFRSQRTVVCSNGDACRYAHGESELRPKPDGSWDPTSDRAKKMMKMESGEEAEVEREEEEGGEGDKSVMMTEVLGESDPMLSKCLADLPLRWTSDRLRNFLSEQSVVFKFARKKKGMTVGFVSFETAEQVQSATEILHGKLAGNKNLKVADVVPRSCDNKIKSAKNEQSALTGGVGHWADVSTSPNENGDKIYATGARAKSARDAVTPLAHMPYPEQLEHKKNAIMQTLKKLTKNARKACPRGVPLPNWLVKSKEIGGLPCKLEGIIESPIVNGYRNKCEFSVGYAVDGKPTVGFMLGNFREGVTAVQEPLDCPNVSKIACKYASIFQGFLQGSTLPIWNRFNNTGFWRQLTVREGRNPERTNTVDVEANISEVLLMVQVCSSGVDAAILNDEFKRMSQALVTRAASSSPPLPLTALVIQDHTGISNVAPADAPLRQLPILSGQSDFAAVIADIDAANEGRIHDYISNLKFSISPTAFFQVNTLAAEKLYSLAGDWAGLGPDTLLFDICCGTGTIGLTLAHRVGMVVGIEMNASAVSDAQRNAELNGIKNCRFVCSKAEDVMASLLRDYLDVAQKQDVTSNFSGSDDKENTEANGESKLADEDIAEGDYRNMESKTCSSETAEGDSACCSVEHDGQESQNQLTRTSAEDGSSEKKHFKNVVAIVDPPRMGLHPVVIKALRTHPHLRRLVYISCNPETLVANAIELCTPSSDKAEKGNRRGLGFRMSNAGLARHRAKSMPKSEPFQPVKAMAVDLFPHTSHCEVVMLLER